MRNYQKGDVVEVWRNSPHRTFIHDHKVGSVLTLEANPFSPKLDTGEAIEYAGSTVLTQDIRPKYWYVQQSNDPRRRRFMEYLRSIKGPWSGNSENAYYGYDGREVHRGADVRPFPKQRHRTHSRRVM
jgi:glutamate synthase domain-containing protein 1